MKTSYQLFEFDYLVAESASSKNAEDGRIHAIPKQAFDWLVREVCRREEEEEGRYARFTRRKGQDALQMQNHVGVLPRPAARRLRCCPKSADMLKAPSKARKTQKSE